MDSFDLVTVGEAIVDIFLWIEDTNKHFRLNPETNEVCIQSGDKALVDKSYFLIGGNAANVSVGIARAGFFPAIVAEIGKDEFAQKILNTLLAEGVSEKYLEVVTHQSTSFSTILNFKGERTIFNENKERDHTFSLENIQTKWIYLTSMARKWEDAYDRTISFVKQKGIKLAFNPGTLQIDEGMEKINEVMKVSEVIFINKEEAAKICGIESSNDEHLIPHLLSEIKKKGVKIVVLTDGAKGAHIIDQDGMVHFTPPQNKNVLERTGAGDAFASGFLVGMLSGVTAQDAMGWGVKNAGSVIENVGAQKGLLTKEQYATSS